MSARTLIDCPDCGHTKPKHALGRCDTCYRREYARQRREEAARWAREDHEPDALTGGRWVAHGGVMRWHRDTVVMGR